MQKENKQLLRNYCVAVNCLNFLCKSNFSLAMIQWKKTWRRGNCADIGLRNI